MDISAVLEPIREFFATGLGQIVKTLIDVLYAAVYPSNAEAAHVDAMGDAVDHATSAVDHAAAAVDKAQEAVDNA